MSTEKITAEKVRLDWEAKRQLRFSIMLQHVQNGVEFVDPQNTYVDETVTIGQATIIYPGVILIGNTAVGSDCIIGHNTRIVDSKIGNGVEIQTSEIIESTVGNGTKIGPFAYIRPNSHIGNNVKVGDFVEIKNSRIGEGTKVPHLTYVGDADLGEHINLGCGVVFVNYDGAEKHRSTIQDDAFIGCNTNIIAPIVVGNKAYIAAGTTLTKDVPSGALAVGRARQANILGWVDKKGILDRKDKK